MDSLKLIDRQKAIVLLSKLFHDPTNLSQAIHENIIRILTSFLRLDDLTCRQKATECIEIISRHELGRSAILEGAVLDHLANLINDPNDLIRVHINTTFARMTANKAGVDQVMRVGLFSKWVQLVNKEKVNIQALVLQSCRSCIRSAEGLVNIALD